MPNSIKRSDSRQRESVKRKKRVRKGLLGYPVQPKRNKILFFVNKIGDSDEESASDDSLDLNYNPDEENSEIKPNLTKNASRLRSASKSVTKFQNSIAKSSDSAWSHDLPYEILLKIFYIYTSQTEGNLNHITLLQNVCQYWNDVAKDSKLWHHVNLSSSIQQSAKQSSNKNAESIKFNKRLNKFLNVVVKENKFQYLEKLDLSNLSYLTYDNLESILGSCNREVLTSLSLANCKKVYVTKYAEAVSFESLIADYCPNLVSLDLTGMQKPMNLTNIKYLMTKLKSNLKFLNISQNTMTSSILNEIFTSCTMLETLNIANSEIKGVLVFDTFPKSLKCLHMLQTYPKTKFTTITSVLTSDVCLENLEQLSISFNSDQFSRDQHFIIAKICKDALNLHTLDIRNYKSSLDRQLNLFSLVNSNRIEKLYLSNANLSDIDKSYLADAIKNKWHSSLIELDLAWSNLSVDFLEVILKSFIANEAITSLKHLNLTGTCVETHMIKNLVTHAPTIKTINLSSCRSIDRGYKKVLTKADLIAISGI